MFFFCFFDVFCYLEFGVFKCSCCWVCGSTGILKHFSIGIPGIF